MCVFISLILLLLFFSNCFSLMLLLCCLYIYIYIYITYDHLYYAPCLACWALFGSFLPAMCNRTSCAQVHDLPQSHCGDNREGTLFSSLHIYYAHFPLWDLSNVCVVDHLWPLIYIYKTVKHFQNCNVKKTKFKT